MGGLMDEWTMEGREQGRKRERERSINLLKSLGQTHFYCHLSCQLVVPIEQFYSSHLRFTFKHRSIGEGRN